MQPVLVSGVTRCNINNFRKFPVISGNIVFPSIPGDNMQKGSPDNYLQIYGLSNFWKGITDGVDFPQSAVQVSSFYFLHSSVKY